MKSVLKTIKTRKKPSEGLVRRRVLAQSGAGGHQARGAAATRGCPGQVPCPPLGPWGDDPGWQWDPRGPCCSGMVLRDVSWSLRGAQFTGRRQRFIGLQMLKAKFSDSADSSAFSISHSWGSVLCLPAGAWALEGRRLRWSRGRSGAGEGARLCLCRAVCGRVALGRGDFVTLGVRAAPCRSPWLCCHPPWQRPQMSQSVGALSQLMSRPRVGTVPTGTGWPFWMGLWVTDGILGPGCRLGKEQGPGEQNWSL